MKYISEKVSPWIAEQVRDAGCKGVVFGLSGGIDSAVVAAICARALRQGNGSEGSRKGKSHDG